MEAKWKEYKGKRIIYADYTGCKKSDDLIKVLHEVVKLESSVEGKSALTLADFRNSCAISTEYMNEAKKLGVEIRNHKVAKTALMGITGIRKVLLSGYQMFTGDKSMKVIEDESMAKEWLIA